MALLASTCVYAAVESPHGDLKLDCNQCHVTAGWNQLLPVLKFDHNSTRYPLVGRHTQVQCIACHTALKFAEAGTNCVDCHADIHRGQFSNHCSECHTSDGWAMTEKMRERHASTRFPLVGVHANLDCQACHANGQYVNLSVQCEGCHLEQYKATENPSHTAAAFSTQCNSCHEVTSAEWKNASFIHTGEFQLTGAHAISDCNACHAVGFSNTTGECYACHAADFNGSVNPDHEAGGFPQDCAMCHSRDSWAGATFDHNLSDFPLTGRHIDVSCAQCHAGGQYTGTPSDCYECHSADYEATTNPNHIEGNYSQNCVVCHSTNGWSPAQFDHNLSDFPLTGRHVDVSCAECHTGDNYSNTPSDCWSCHEQNYRDSDNPDHEVLSFPQDCAGCHTTAGWSPATIDHNLTEYPLTGRHIEVTCTECHIGGNYSNTPTDCWACHEQNYRDSDNPDHEVLNFPQACATCHTTNGWSPASFDHNNTDFPLTGRHVTANCTQCHIDGNYTNTPTDCWSCHQSNYQGADNHVEDNYPHDCAMCHSTSNWESTFNHNNTNFPLTGRHIQTNCSECHSNGQFEGTPTDCWSCHQEDYNDAEDHVSGSYPHDCAQCHNTDDWDEGGFNHNNTDFPLTGRHVTTACALCHVSGQFEGTPTDCWACHEAQFRATTNPDHETAGFPQTCASCHGTDGWSPASFDHNNSGFPLTGRHVTIACLDCHVGGNYNNTPTDCFFCHAQDYHDANDPNHDAGFPTTCADCHNTTDWEQAQFNHDQQWFPIYSGRHEGEWNNCSDCHTNPDNFLVFSCIDCHEHNRNDTDDEHDEVGNYVYESQACYNCHPRGDGDDRPNLRHVPRRSVR